MNVIKKLTGYKQSLYKPEMRPKAVLFDVNGTIFPATAAAPALRELGLDENLVPLWFASVLRDATSAQAAGLLRPFKEIGAHHLEVMLREAGKEEWSRVTGHDAIKKVMEAGAAAPLFPDIPEALRQLNNANIKVWKPFPSSYQFAVKQLGLPADKVCMVAVHPWDITGAMQASLRGVYVQRNPCEAWPEFLPAPDAVAQDFSGLLELFGFAGPADKAAESGSPTKAGSSAV